jgi:transcriptional/translational regulatory protein YebC/TACO1
VHSQKLVYVPKNPVALEPQARTEVEAFLVALDEDDDVQDIFVALAE